MKKRKYPTSSYRRRKSLGMQAQQNDRQVVSWCVLTKNGRRRKMARKRIKTTITENFTTSATEKWRNWIRRLCFNLIRGENITPISYLQTTAVYLNGPGVRHELVCPSRLWTSIRASDSENSTQRNKHVAGKILGEYTEFRTITPYLGNSFASTIV